MQEWYVMIGRVSLQSGSFQSSNQFEQVYSERGASSPVMTNMIIFLTILVYGVNFLAFMYIKIKEIKNYLEKIAIYFGVNMTLLFTSSIFLFFGKIVEDGILLIE